METPPNCKDCMKNRSDKSMAITASPPKKGENRTGRDPMIRIMAIMISSKFMAYLISVSFSKYAAADLTNATPDILYATMPASIITKPSISRTCSIVAPFTSAARK